MEVSVKLSDRPLSDPLTLVVHILHTGIGNIILRAYRIARGCVYELIDLRWNSSEATVANSLQARCYPAARFQTVMHVHVLPACHLKHGRAGQFWRQQMQELPYTLVIISFEERSSTSLSGSHCSTST